MASTWKRLLADYARWRLIHPAKDTSSTRTRETSAVIRRSYRRPPARAQERRGQIFGHYGSVENVTVTGIHRDRGAAVVPQAFDKRYFTPLVIAPYSDARDAHLYTHPAASGRGCANSMSVIVYS